MEALPFKHVQQQRRSARGRRRLLFTNLILSFNSDNAQFTHHQTGDDNQSTSSFFEVGSVVDTGRSVRASRCSLESKIMYTAICGTGDHCAANSSFDMERSGMFRRNAVPDQQIQCEGPRTALICSRLTNDTDSVTCEGVAIDSWFPGQLVWAKLIHFPWWPAQVMDERCVNDDSRPQRLLKDDILVRFFGVYNFAWVDPLLSLSKFDMHFEERSRILRTAFQKGLKEALEYRDFRRLPDNWRVFIRAQNVEESDIKPNGIEFSVDSNSHEQTKVEGQEEAKLDGLHRLGAARKRKPKMLYEEEERLHRKPDRKTRRRRIMRDLGLAAPYGSPFALNSFSRTPM